MEDFLLTNIQPLVEKISKTIHKESDLGAPELMRGYTLIYRFLLDTKTSEKDIEDVHSFQKTVLSRFVAGLDCEKYDDLIIAHSKFMQMKKSLGILFYYTNRLYRTGLEDNTFIDGFIYRHANHLFGIVATRLLDVSQSIVDAVGVFRALDKDLGRCVYDRFESFLITFLSGVFEETYIGWASFDSPLYIQKVLEYESMIRQIMASNNILESWKKTQKELVRVFVSHRMDIIECFSDCLKNNTDLENHYRFVKLHDLGLCVQMYKDYLKESIKSYPKDGKSLIDFMIRFDAEEKLRLFAMEKEFQTILYEHWKIFVNKNRGVMMLLVKHMDKQIRKGIDDLKALEMFCYVNDKDEFLNTYKSLFAKRLIGEDTPDLELERHYIVWLENKMTRSYVLPLFTMINEYVMNKENNLKWNCNPGIQVMIVCYSQWGISRDPVVYRLPHDVGQEMSQYLDHFRKNKTFTFIHHLGTVHLRGIFPCGRVYEFVMSPVQALYLLRMTDEWQDVESLETVISDKRDVNCGAILGSLGCLVEKDQAKGYRLKSSWQSKKRVHRLSSIELVRSDEETTKRETSFDRCHVIDAAIIRILKSKKKMYFKDLLVDMQKYIKTFQPEIADIKTRVSRLIDNDFVARDEHDNNLILYVS